MLKISNGTVIGIAFPRWFIRLYCQHPHKYSVNQNAELRCLSCNKTLEIV